RLIAGLALGAIIGFERELHRQPAGFRTHSLVSLGAALFAIISAYGYGGANIDPTRITAQIVSGIGFIGAGTILQSRGRVRGLTTPASLWSAAPLGAADGTGLYVLAMLGTVLILVVLSLLDRVEDFARQRLVLRRDGDAHLDHESLDSGPARGGPMAPARQPGPTPSSAPTVEHDQSDGQLEDLR